MERKTRTNQSTVTEHALDQAMVRVGPLTSLPAVLRDLNCDPEPIFRSFGFKPSQFDNPDFELPFLPGSHLLARCVEATDCQHLGLLIGKRADPSCLGIPAFTMRAASDVRTGLRALLRHWELHDQGGVPTLTSSGSLTLLGFAIHLPGVKAAPQIYDISMSVACKIMRSLCGASWDPTGVLLSRPPPQDPNPYKRYFRAPIRFDTDQSAVAFQTQWLDHQLPGADPYLFDFLDQMATELAVNRPLDLIGRLRRFLCSSLATEECSLTTAAQHLGMHGRTLNRRLQRKGTTFRQELDNIRYEVARNFLVNSDATHEEIASALGYADSAAFSRSFRRWSGMTPSRWRTRNRNKQ